ncbi:MAG: hypothetical protein PHR16_17775 [Methylovulum sp.]|nr:hypothetical protein [Methylovulum sp.]
MRYIKVFFFVCGCLCAAPSWAEMLTVLGTGKETYTVYDQTGNKSQGSKYTNEFITLVPATYLVKLNGEAQTVTLAAGQNLSLPTGKFRLNGTGYDSYRMYDQYAREGRGSSLYTNQEIVLFPGAYVVNLNNSTAPISVEADKTATLDAGRLSVAGTGYDSFFVYDEFGRETRGNSLYTNKERELLAGRYLVSLNGSKIPADVQAGTKTTANAGRLTVTGIGLDSFTVYDELGENILTYSSFRTNKEVELFPGGYKLGLNGTWKIGIVTAGQRAEVAAGILTFPGTATETYLLYKNIGEILSYTSYHGGDRVELFPDSYLLKPSSNQQTSVTVTVSGTIDPAISTYEMGFSTGILKCQTNPVSCGMSVGDNTDGSTQQGIEQCKQNPVSCGIQVNANTDGSTQQGIEQCKQNPAACGIQVNANTDGSTQQGIEQCKQNPISCGIQVNANTDGSTQQGIEQCKQNPVSCGIQVTTATGNPNMTTVATVSSNLNLQIPYLVYQPIIGEPVNLWALLGVYKNTSEQGRLLFELLDFNVVE